jgi:hypothetical protein
MPRQRKIDEELWEDGEEELSSDHVVERFFSQHERDGLESSRKGHVGAKPKRRPPLRPETDD